MSLRLPPAVTFSLIALLMLFWPLKYAHADTGKADLHTTIDGYSVELVFPDGQPKAGPNTMLVRILDAGGQPPSNARVQVAAVVVQSAAATAHGHGESGGYADVSAGRSAGSVADSHNDTNVNGHSDAAPTDHQDTHADNAIAPHADAATDDHRHTTGADHIDTIMTQMEAGIDAGSYTSVIHFDSAGAWDVQLQFNHTGVDHAAHFAVTVAEPARDWRILGAFGGANALIILTAGILKRRLPVTAKGLRRATAADAEN
jgi:hypothetical protein